MTSTRGQQGTKKIRKLMTAAFGDDHVGAPLDEQEQARHEIQVYLANTELSTDENGEFSEDVLSFWKRSESFYLILAKVARFVFTAITCSTESQRVLSTAGLLRNKQRQVSVAQQVSLLFLQFASFEGSIL